MLVKVLNYQYFFDTTFKTILLSKVPKLRLKIQTCTDMNVITNMKRQQICWIAPWLCSVEGWWSALFHSSSASTETNWNVNLTGWSLAQGCNSESSPKGEMFKQYLDIFILICLYYQGLVVMRGMTTFMLFYNPVEVLKDIESSYRSSVEVLVNSKLRKCQSSWFFTTKTLLTFCPVVPDRRHIFLLF